MAKYSVPSIKFTEIDNTIRTSGTPGLGVGAIVLKSNKGPANQRILTSSYDEFKTVFGDPEELTDYGHFAAERFLNVSNQLYAVRATMGDESYAQIQYPYTDTEANYVYKTNDVASFKYTDNEDTAQLDLCDPLSNVTNVTTLTADGEWRLDPADTESSNTIFAGWQQAGVVTINDLITDASTQVAVFKSRTSSDFERLPELNAITVDSGVYVEFPQNVAKDGTVTKKYDDLIFTNDAWNSTDKLAADNFIISRTPVTAYVNTTTSGETTSAVISGFRVKFNVPASATLNNASVACTMYLTPEAIESVETSSMTYSSLFNDNNFYKGIYSVGEEVEYVTTAEASKLQFKDWDDLTTKTYYVKKDEAEESVAQAYGLSFREYGMSDKMETLVIDDGSNYKVECYTINEILTPDDETNTKKIPEDFILKVEEIAEEYGVEKADINSDEFSIISYVNVNEGYGNLERNENGSFDPEDDTIRESKRTYKLIYTDSYDKDDRTSKNDRLFWIYSKKDSDEVTSKSVYVAETPEGVYVPWQEGMVSQKSGVTVNKMNAYPTSEVLNSAAGTYKDGYTLTKESDEEPGVGDIEEYESNMENQLIIAAIGPGKFGNDIGVSIITTECADIPALNHQNAFSWKYRYDDEDLVNKDDPDVDFTWKKVYRINVYTKTKTQTAEGAWGTGLDALLKDPTESWFVSNDPQAKDAEGNSLFAPNVINGKSDYIYVSRNSVNDAMTGSGEYAHPVQTFAIYGLTGGANSKKNNIVEKTQALKLFADRQKSDFDILFNVEAIDTFNGKQRFAAHQRRIAEIAASRTMDIGVVQLTSKESKTIKRMLSEAKSFSFDNGSYVAGYAGYDKYYNSTLASWIYLPKSVAGAVAMAYCDIYSYPWMAPAGTARGTISYTSGQLVQLSDDEIGQLYDNNINTSRPCGGYGEILWGQKTALKKESALNRINVRRCLNYIEKNLENMLVPYMFAQNTANTRSAAKNQIDSFLSRVRAAEGVIEYATSVTDDADDEHIMNVNIVVRPAEAIEYIDVKITVTRTSINVTDETITA